MAIDNFGLFLRDAGRIPLLTPNQEIILARAIQEMIALQDRGGPYTKEENKTIKRGNKAKTKFINANLRLVINISKKYCHRLTPSLDMLDLIQEGCLGLTRAVEKYDFERGYKFSTYAYWWVRQSISRALDSHSHTIRKPVHVCEILNKIRTYTRLRQLNGESPPTPQEIAKHLGITIERVFDITQHSNTIGSLDAAVSDGSTNLIEFMQDKNPQPFELAEIKDAQIIVETVMGTLSEIEQFVLIHRHGLDGVTAKTLNDVGKEIKSSKTEKLSRERIRQIEKAALGKLRRQLEKYELVFS